MNTCAEEKARERPSLSIIAIVCFITAFLITRAFTTLNPHVALRIGIYHVHHFWYGVALLAIGGWLGIGYQSRRIDRLAAILFGAGGGIIVDEIGLILTLRDYWAGITYVVVIIFLAIVLLLAFFLRYSRTIALEFAGLARNVAGVYFCVFLTVVSLAVLLETSNLAVATVSSGLAIISCLVIVGYFVQRFRKRR